MDSFGGRLRYERERRQIALKSIAESTKIGITLLEGLERDDVSRWPSGIFRKSFVRSYAVAVGLDPERVLREFVERHPDPLEVDIATPSAGPRCSRTRHLVAIISRSSSHQAHHHLERIGTSHPCKIGRLEDCQNVVGSSRSDSAISQHSANLPICQSPNAAFS